MIINIAELVSCDTANLVKTAEPDVDKRRNACFQAKKLLSGLVYDMSSLENNPFTFPEVQTLLDGITAGGHKLSDQQQVLNLSISWKYLIQKVLQGEFELNKAFFCLLHKLVAKEEALTWGLFRDSQVYISGTDYKPPVHSELDQLFGRIIIDVNKVENVIYKAALFFLSCSRAQFFHDGNKRTSRLMMNGILMSYGFDAILISNKKHLEFNQKMVLFYDSGDGTDMINFLCECQPLLKQSLYV